MKKGKGRVAKAQQPEGLEGTTLVLAPPPQIPFVTHRARKGKMEFLCHLQSSPVSVLLFVFLHN